MRIHVNDRAASDRELLVAYDGSLANGAALADAVVQSCEGGLSAISELFGNIMPPVTLSRAGMQFWN